MFLSLACYFWRQNLKDLHVLFRDMNIRLNNICNRQKLNIKKAKIIDILKIITGKQKLISLIHRFFKISFKCLLFCFYNGHIININLNNNNLKKS